MAKLNQNNVDLSSPIRTKHGRLKNKKPVKAETLKRREYQRKRYQEKKAHINEINIEWRKNNKERRHWHEAKRRYGVTFELYKELMKQDCKICGESRNDSDKRFAIDHCHKSEHEDGVMRIRGVLCHNCNHGLGKFKDDINLLQSAIDYLVDKDNSIDYNDTKIKRIMEVISE